VYAYSTSGGHSWTEVDTVFSNAGVSKASIWYDSSNNIVYAVGDRGTTSRNIYIQRGEVSPSTHTIAWEASDEAEEVSTSDGPNKESFISKDANGYLWMMVTDVTQPTPTRYNLKVFKSTSTDDISVWSSTGSMLGTVSSSINIKGSVLPTGSGSDVWAVYNYDADVAAKKYASGSGSWGSEESIYDAGSGTWEFSLTAPASAVIDGSGVPHVVYGDGTKDGSTQKPHIKYTYRGASAWVASVTLDTQADTVGQKYPSISKDTSTGNLYAIWLQMSNNNVICKKYASSTWSFLTIGGQNTYTKQHLTSVYSASGESNICWQWTQNTTGTIEVIFDKIPEFQDVALPVFTVLIMFLVISRRRSSRRKKGDEDPTGLSE
jgi:hypothetical protein